jgi:serine/threonine protein kinase/CheY-like chemotaxis protein
MSDNKQSILLVDDDKLNRKIVSLYLEKEGFEVLESGNGHEALAILSKRRIDLVLLDRMMPGFNGIEVLTEARLKYSTTELPVVMMTALSESSNIAEALESGANDYITKPIDFTVAIARIRAQLRQKPPKETPQDIAIGPGSILAKKYQLEEKIGSGGFSSVYRAIHLDLRSQVAVKILSGGSHSTEEALARFRLEGISSAQAHHPNVVSVIDFGVLESGVVFLVMEMLHGHNLEEELRRKGPLPPQRCAEILLPICDALSSAHHKGIIHRDVKPANIFLHQGALEIPKLLDFGVAKLTGSAAAGENITTRGCIFGTVGYLAPERLRGEFYDGRVDVYSLGVSLYEMLTGRLPFLNSTAEPMAIAMMHLNDMPLPPSSFRAGISREVEELVLSALAKYPTRRPGIDEFAHRLSLTTREDSSHAIIKGRRVPLLATPIQMPALSPERPQSENKKNGQEDK